MLLPRGVLKLAMCAASEKTRYAMDGLAVERSADGVVKVTATDGKRLVRAELSPMTDTARALAASRFATSDDGAAIGLTVIPCRDEMHNGETVSLGLLSLMRSERKASSMARKADKGTDKPSKPKMTALPKRPKLATLPILPKRSAFVPNEGESIDACLARFRAELSEARERVRLARVERSEIIQRWNGVRAVVKRTNADRVTTFKADIQRWKADRSEARKARDVIALDVRSGRSLIGVELAPKRVREMSALEGHYPPCDDAIPRPDRANAHELIIDARALTLIVDAWRASLRADERAELGEHATGKDADELSGIVLEMEGQNVTMRGRINGRSFALSEAQAACTERWMRVVNGEGKRSIGLNAYLLGEMAEALNAAIGVSGHAVRIGIKNEHDAILVAPLSDDVSGHAFAPSVRGVKVTGVLMPINLS